MCKYEIAPILEKENHVILLCLYCIFFLSNQINFCTFLYDMAFILTHFYVSSGKAFQ